MAHCVAWPRRCRSLRAADGFGSNGAPAAGRAVPLCAIAAPVSSPGSLRVRA
jgi:hypothetical protein